jgi:type II secretory pathway pseudopilin PulG
MKKHAYTLLEIMIVVAFIGFLATLAIPGFMKARDVARKNSCVEGLRLIDAAQQQWAMEKGLGNDAPVTAADLMSYFSRNEFPKCPANGVLSVTTVGEKPKCTKPGHVLP